MYIRALCVHEITKKKLPTPRSLFLRFFHSIDISTTCILTDRKLNSTQGSNKIALEFLVRESNFSKSGKFDNRDAIIAAKE